MIEQLIFGNEAPTYYGDTKFSHRSINRNESKVLIEHGFVEITTSVAIPQFIEILKWFEMNTSHYIFVYNTCKTDEIAIQYPVELLFYFENKEEATDFKLRFG